MKDKSWEIEREFIDREIFEDIRRRKERDKLYIKLRNKINETVKFSEE